MEQYPKAVSLTTEAQIRPADEGKPPSDPGSTGGVRGSVLAALTPREREIALLVAEGRSNGQIARALGLTVRSVKNRLTVIFEKTHVRSRVQLALAMRHS